MSLTQWGKLAHQMLKMPQDVWEYSSRGVDACMDTCVDVWVTHAISFYSLTQQKGPSYRFGVPVPSGGHLPWTPSRGLTSQASGLGTPMDPTLPV